MQLKGKRIIWFPNSRRKGRKIKLIPRNSDNEKSSNSGSKSIQMHGIIQMTLNRLRNGSNT